MCVYLFPAALFMVLPAAPCHFRLYEPTVFVRGDFDCSERIELRDALLSLAFLFKGGSPPSCPDAADANDDGRINLSDAVHVLLHLFGGGSMPSPYPWAGFDPSLDLLGCTALDAGCPSFQEVTRLGKVLDPSIMQPSGIAPSRTHAGICWLVNDQDNGRNPRLYALEQGGGTVASFRLCTGGTDCDGGATPLEIHSDWEGLAIGPGEGGQETLYIGDLGTNRPEISRSRSWIHRIKEPDLTRGPTEQVLRRNEDFDTLFIRYPTNLGISTPRCSSAIPGMGRSSSSTPIVVSCFVTRPPRGRASWWCWRPWANSN